MHKTIITEDERQILVNHYQNSQIKLVSQKSHAILLHFKEYTPKQLEDILLKDKRTIQRWLSDFSSRRIASIFSGHVDNENASKLTRQQKKEIAETLSRPPSEHDLPKEFWDVPILKEYVSAEFGVVYESEQSYHFLLKFSGLSFKYPDKQSPRRDDEFTERRMQEIRLEIEPFLKDTEWEVFVADETRLEKQSEIRKAWLTKGKRTVVKTERSKEHRNFLGFLGQKDGRCNLFEISRGNTDEIIRVLREMVDRFRGKNLCIIWDNASWHRSKGLRELLGQGNEFGNIHLIWLPPYSPDKNPIEHVWNWAKGQIANRSILSMEELTKDFLKTINYRTFDYKL